MSRKIKLPANLAELAAIYDILKPLKDGTEKEKEECREKARAYLRMQDPKLGDDLPKSDAYFIQQLQNKADILHAEAARLLEETYEKTLPGLTKKINKMEAHRSKMVAARDKIEEIKNKFEELEASGMSWEDMEAELQKYTDDRLI